jgi:hypothetical protein
MADVVPVLHAFAGDVAAPRHGPKSSLQNDELGAEAPREGRLF